MLEEIISKVKKEFPNKPFERILKNIEEIFQYKYWHLLSVFELNTNKQSSDLDEAILDAFTKSIDKAHMIRLCMYWNRADRARKIFEDQTSEKVLYLDKIIFLYKINFVNNKRLLYLTTSCYL